VAAAVNDPGGTASPGASPDASPRAIVESFLRSLEARDLAAAAALLRPGARMTFPGGNVFHRLEDLVAWSGPRYRFVRKRFDRFDEIDLGGGRAIVYCLGTLSGEWPDGRPLAGVRYVDRFEIEAGWIVDQQVWNDLDAARAALPPS
jgi:hypothetical protein